MRGNPATTIVLRPRHAREAVRLYASAPDALPVAGGTDVMVAWNLGAFDSRPVLDLAGIDAWTDIEAAGGGLSIGALTTHAAIRDHRLVRRHFGLLAQSAATIGGVQIQNRGTLGGNIANASPAGDTFPALAVYDAAIRIRALHGDRIVPFLELFAGPKKTHLATGELIEAIDLPALVRPPDRQLFRKVCTRAAQAISKVVIAAVLWQSKDGGVDDLRIAVGSVAPTVRRLRSVEAAVAGRPLTGETIERAVACVAGDIAPIDDLRSTREYRLLVCERLVAAFLSGFDPPSR